ncbi:hypothetical protein Fmac_026568 [Flemingia macrophylla]|uniref:G-patch domain-containing protein n=1 Tax=Flemingia macrophylla TaxID=520843 RepID=A0ABD1LF84_9FABA
MHANDSAQGRLVNSTVGYQGQQRGRLQHQAIMYSLAKSFPLRVKQEPHRKALLKVLKEAYVPHSISQEKFEGIVSHITANDHLTFIDEEIPPEGANNNKPLHIFVKCKKYLISKELVDNGSSLNVMSMHTLEQVMDITPAYSYLLGRPWIHDAKVVPSTLHQKIKFVVSDKLVTVQVEDDMLISKPPALPYMDVAKEAIETSFQALEIANVEKFPCDMKMVARMLTKTGYQPGQGLCKNSQGIIEPPIIRDSPRRQGLGYDSDKDRNSAGKEVPPRRSLDQIFRKAEKEKQKPAKDKGLGKRKGKAPGKKPTKGATQKLGYGPLGIPQRGLPRQN